MKTEMEKRRKLYRRALQKEPVLLQISDDLYKEKNEETTQSVSSIYVLAPVMCRYIIWVLQEAMRTGRKRLYFLARDGYSMYCVAKTLCETAQIPIECKYLHCSRFAWRSAEYLLLKEKSLKYICLGGIDVSFGKLMERAGLSQEEGIHIAELLGYNEKYEVAMTYNEIKAMEPVLAECKEFVDLMLQHSKEKYPLVCNYLRQEGLMDSIPFAIVDSGWVGSMQKCLQNILNSMGGSNKVEGYYFGMYEYPDEVDECGYHMYYFAPYRNLRRKVYFNNNLFECIFSSPEGMTVCFEQIGEAIVPVMEKKRNPNRDKIKESTECLKEYAYQLAVRFPEVIKSGEHGDESVIEALLSHFMGRPSIEEAKEYGGYVFCDDVIGEEAQTVAATLSAREIKENRLLHKATRFLLKQKKYVRESAWPEASVMLAEGVSRTELFQCSLCNYVRFLRKSLKRRR